MDNRGNRPAEQSRSTAAPKTSYNNSNHYSSSSYDPYYALYDDDVDLYKDVGKIAIEIVVSKLILIVTYRI